MNERYRWSPHVEATELDGEWVVMDAQGMTMSRLNEVGGFIWSQFEREALVESVTVLLTETYDVGSERALAEVRDFVQSLHEAGLLEHVG